MNKTQPKHTDLHAEHETHVTYMRQALELARRGEGRTAPNPAVGAVIVADGKVVGRGYQPKAGEAHAEIFALREAGSSAQGADAYVTLEPCSHHGRTAPCCDALIAAGIRRVFVGLCDPNPLVDGRGVRRLRAAGVEVVTGILEAECRYLCAPFVKHVTTGRPLVVLKSAITLDGKTATSTGSSQWITGSESRAHVHQVRDHVDAILVGIGTVRADNPRLTTRLDEKPGHDPIRVVLDSNLSIEESAALVQHNSTALTLIMTTASADAHKRSKLEACPLVEVVNVAQDATGRIDLKAVLAELGRRQIQSVLVEGGAQVNQALLQQDLVDRVMFYIAPKLLGGSDGFGIFSGTGPEWLDAALNIDITNVRRFGVDILIEGEVCRCLPV
ncbi:MAG: bifunctional diaminohydroxyphosphoribosylaminopyrimidine deaminase/5-amino-6-(5-phosphoribosylamino)uracil reductase RibD [Desulfuromonas sp.]|nr:bifunctional diaminohydroxyphosphoribosylaminopyrimidine deaminase/5-amino-6-(5-phosphoribosylamino)uracil reductase RibD [Desulfuromonas sp.]